MIFKLLLTNNYKVNKWNFSMPLQTLEQFGEAIKGRLARTEGVTVEKAKSGSRSPNISWYEFGFTHAGNNFSLTAGTDRSGPYIDLHHITSGKVRIGRCAGIGTEKLGPFRKEYSAFQEQTVGETFRMVERHLKEIAEKK